MPSWPVYDDADVATVVDILRAGTANYWTGTHGRTLEAEYAASLGRAHAIAVANGTVALELSLRAFEIGVGDEVVIPSRTFIATASAVTAVGATPVVADIDAVSGNLTAATAEAVLTSRTRAIIAVHVGGWPVDIESLSALAASHDLIVIEDCAQAHGATMAGRQVGAPGTHAAAFSFCQDKVISAGEGGMLVLDDDDAFARAWAYKDHGKSLARIAETGGDESGTSFRWLVESFGTNWRMHEVAAVLARGGLVRLPKMLAARRANAERLAAGIAGAPGLRVPLPEGGTRSAFYRLYAHVLPEALAPGWDRDRIISAIVAEGVPCQYGSCCEIYRERAFTTAGLGPADRLPGAAAAHETQLAFYVHPTLTAEDIDDTIAAVRKVMEVAAS
ncbi:MAG: DegT/DnrJ/EryC1/StrS aminotransferase family protein [Actinobacteria bacterium]|nr:MAG: DegT/DnrJ/EryC1/StrS aminotransferase family protein [Actinomycetota bacterium]